MDLRPYQVVAVEKSLHAWQTYNRLIGVAATGAGKTVIASHILLERFPTGPALFIAHRKELLSQAIDKLYRVTGLDIGLEQAQSRSHLGHKIVVASVGSLHAERITKWQPDHFSTVVIDECHRSTAKTYQDVLNYFTRAKTLGITATPDRADQKSLGTIFEHIAFEIGLVELIRDGWLSPIRVENIPLQIDLDGIKLDTTGDLDVTETAHRLEPYLESLVREMILRPERKILVFLPLVRLSEKFAEIAQSYGAAAEHIDGTFSDADRRALLARYKAGETRIVSCAALLTEGYDEPSIDCICMMRPTQSRTLYCQCLGRGFRPYTGKTNLLVLDPLWLSNEHNLVKPANLVAATADEAEQITMLLASGNFSDILKAKDRVGAISLEIVRRKAAALAKRLDANSKRERKLFDPLEFASIMGNPEFAGFDPVVPWHEDSVSPKQANVLRNFGVDPKALQNRGHAHQILTHLFQRRAKKLATFRQMRCLIKYQHPSPQTATFEEATKFLDFVFAGASSLRKPETSSTR